MCNIGTVLSVTNQSASKITKTLKVYGCGNMGRGVQRVFLAGATCAVLSFHGCYSIAKDIKKFAKNKAIKKQEIEHCE